MVELIQSGTKKQSLVPYHWQGTNQFGKEVEGDLTTYSQRHATLLLKKEGITVRKIQRVRAKRLASIPQKEIIQLIRQLATMLKAGVSIVQAFSMMTESSHNPAIKDLLMTIKLDIETGMPLTGALQKHPRYFDNLMIAILRAGEEAGKLVEMSERLAFYKEKMFGLKQKIKSALTYPAAVIVISFIVTAIILVKVVPSFKKVFEDFGAKLPAPTLMLLQVSDFMVEYWMWICGGIIAGIYFFKQSLKRSPAFRAWVDKMVLKAPLFGQLIQNAIIARWARTFNTLFSSGVPLVDVLNTVAVVADNHVFAQATRRVQLDVSSGIKLSVAMRDTQTFPIQVVQMIGIGEESGALESMFDHVASKLEDEVDVTVGNMSSLIEPFIMAFLGIVIGGIMVAMYLPIFQIGNAI